MQKMSARLLTGALGLGLLLATAPSVEAHGFPIPPDLGVAPEPPAPTILIPGIGQGNAPLPIPGGIGRPTPGVTPGQGTPNSTPTPGTTPGVRTLGATPTNRTAAFGRTTRRRSKARLAPWRADLRIPWTQAVLPVEERQGYTVRQLGVDEAIKRDLADGGWLKADCPSLVFVHDSRRAEHRRALEALQGDLRFLSAANLFNCFLLDARMIDAPSDGKLQLKVYGVQGELLGKVEGKRRLRGSFELLEKAYQAHRQVALTKVLPRVTWLLDEQAKASRSLKNYEHALVCPDCGKNRDDAKTLAKTMRTRLRAVRKNLALLR